MPTLFNMADAKNTNSEMPVVITQVTEAVPKPRNTKKYVIIGVSAILTVAIILAAILVGMYMFTQAEKDLIKFTMNVDKDTTQDVTSDPDNNVVEYHVQNSNYEMWVIDDYNRDIEVMKVKTDTATTCYAVPFNRTAAADPSQIKAPSNVVAQENATDSLSYIVSNTPVTDSSFLSQKAKDACNGISVYWMYPKCDDGSTSAQRLKRGYYCYYYYYYYYYYGYIYYRIRLTCVFW